MRKMWPVMVLGATVFASPEPAAARLSDPGMGGAIGGGSFGGVRLGPAKAAQRPPETRPAGVTGENCYLLTQQVGIQGPVVRRVLLCR